MSRWRRDIADFFFPRTCLVCGRVLLQNEDHICTHCILNIPRTAFHNKPDNTVAQLFYGKIPIERCSAYFFFDDGSDYRSLIHHIKYGNQKECGQYLGYMWAKESMQSNFFEGIDYIIPIPLHSRKLRLRGYNQSEWIAQGIADATNIELCTDALICLKHNISQTHKGIYERWLSAHDNYEYIPNILPEGCHILLVDDVITTGATMLACATTLLNNGVGKVSIATLAIAR